jgi:hypothetical protein
LSINIPPSLDWLFEITAGQSWPRGDEDLMRELGGAWQSAQQELADIAAEISPAAENVLAGFTGPAADQFAQFVSELRSNVPAMADGAGQIADLADQMALSIETSKYMILLMEVWMAEQIAEWASTIWDWPSFRRSS